VSRIIDISQPLGRATATWPGDTRFESFWVMRQDRGDSCNVGSVTMSLHTATHMDAPLHFLQNAAGADGIDLTACVGPALLVDLQGVREVLPEHLSTVEPGLMERVLLKTGTARYDRFEPDFGCLSEAAACRLAECGVRLVGIDTPSVDRSDSKSLGTHRVLAGAGIVILENLRLDDVGPGIYELIALPLRLEEMDASPVRAILRTIGDP
jgi:arylformamidase